MKPWLKACLLACGPLAALSVIAGPLVAHDHGMRIQPVKDTAVAKECSACHMLYPAGLLPARSWSAMIAGLDDHFGDNAALDDATARRIADYLAANAADRAGGSRKLLRGLAPSEAPLRITELPSWRHKHEKKDRVAPATLKRKGATFKGDCKACHQDAEQGWFDDDG
ncbi:MAG: cytochrome C [Bacteroidales bacterium]|nr:cytochrome C [Bacteroidales bacterium]